MPIVPGWLVALVTFPGVIVHESAHFLFCRLRKVPVLDACFLQFRNPAAPVGFVTTGPISDFTTSFLVTIGPFLLNSALCIVICFPAFMPMQVFDIEEPLSYVLMWLGVSIGMHSFPSPQDGRMLWIAAKEAAAARHPLALMSFPLVMVIYAVNVLSFFWLDYAYGLALGVGLPRKLLQLLQ